MVSSSRNALQRTHRGGSASAGGEKELEVEVERGVRRDGGGEEYKFIVSATPGFTPVFCRVGSIVLSYVSVL